MIRLKQLVFSKKGIWRALGWFSALCLGVVMLGLACTLPAGLPGGATPAPTLTSPPTQPPATPTPTLAPTPTVTPTPLPAVRVLNGDRALFNGDWEGALAAYRTALDASDDPQIESAALVGIGHIYYLTGDYPAALDALRAVIENYPQESRRAEADYFLGRVYDALTRYEEAAQAYASYRTLRPGVIDAYISELIGDARYAAGDYNGALAEYQIALQSPRLPTDFALELKMAQTYALVGDYATAQVMYDDILARSSNEYTRAYADYLKGSAYVAQGLPEQAYAAYLDAVQSYPLAYSAYLSLVELVNAGYPVDELQRGIVDYNAGEYGVALAALDRYLETGAEQAATAHYYRGLALRAQGDYAGAIAAWDTLIANFPNSAEWADAWADKAETLWIYLDDIIGAQQVLLDFVAQAPQSPRAPEYLYQAARLAERDGRLEEAARLWERLPGEYPTFTQLFRALFLAGISRYRLGEFPAAQSGMLNALAHAGDPAERSSAYFWVGKMQAAQGDQEAARATWEQVTAMDPTGYYSERARDLLAGRTLFTAPEMFDLGMDVTLERAQAEAWLKQTFTLPPEIDLSVPGKLAEDPRFQRGQEFWRLGLYEQAWTEFDHLRQESELDPANSYRLAVHLMDLGLYRLAILAARQVLDLAGMDDAATLTAPALFSHIRFGPYFSELVIPAADQYEFHPLFAWSHIRQESLFEPFITSSAGARGLLQIMPATGQDIVYRLGWPENYRDEDLYRPLINLTLGMRYLDEQRDYFDGDLLAALAAYNGGPGNAAVWHDLAQGDPDLFLEVIRFDETRQYLRGIYEVFTIYRRLYEHSPEG